MGDLNPGTPGLSPTSNILSITLHYSASTVGFLSIVQGPSCHSAVESENSILCAWILKKNLLSSSTKFIEGTVIQLLEEEECVVGVLYREKETGDTKVSLQVSCISK